MSPSLFDRLREIQQQENTGGSDGAEAPESCNWIDLLKFEIPASRSDVLDSGLLKSICGSRFPSQIHFVTRVIQKRMVIAYDLVSAGFLMIEEYVIALRTA